LLLRKARVDTRAWLVVCARAGWLEPESSVAQFRCAATCRTQPEAVRSLARAVSVYASERVGACACEGSVGGGVLILLFVVCLFVCPDLAYEVEVYLVWEEMPCYPGEEIDTPYALRVHQHARDQTTHNCYFLYDGELCTGVCSSYESSRSETLG